MSEHPISSLMDTAMRSIKEMIDVNTIVGDAVNTSDGGVIIPISKVSFGFAAGGGEYAGKKENRNEGQQTAYPFAGGSGAGVSITPVAFMFVRGEECRLVPANINCSIDRIVELIPNLMQKVEKLITQKLSRNESSDDSSWTESSDYDDEESGTKATGMNSSNDSKQTKKTTNVSTQSKKHVNDYQSYLNHDIHETGSDPDFPPPS